MNSKIQCTCGWSWNKSDSSKKDMYICHECGRDNSNNIKNGGWLDNYNDSKTSVPEGYEGEGYSMKGRDYSPAWGGQFQMGGDVYPVNYVPQAAMGGSIPGAVGFSYARTQGAAPSNGKYAKKTMASAQDGKKLDMYGNPILADLKYDQSVNRTNYNPRTNQMIFGHDMPLFISQEERDKTLAHENRHAWQFNNDRTNFDIVHNPEYAFQERLKKKAVGPVTDEVFEDYHDRKRKEIDVDVRNFMLENPNLSFMPNDLIYNKFVDSDQYSNPASVEGEAQYYQETGKEFQNGGEMRYYQNGLDWKPKGMKDGGWLDGYDKAQDGDILDKWRADHPTVRSFINTAQNRKIQESKGKGKETAITQKDNTKTVKPKIGKVATAKEKEQRAIEQNKLAYEESQKEAAKDWVQNSMQEVYKHPLGSPGYFTPEGAIIGALQGATKMGPDLYEGNYKGAAMDALMMLPIAIPAAKTLKNIKTSVAPELREGLQTSGFSDIFKSKPKSEINWGNWNKEIPENSQLMKEYNAIEQTTKANGSWMKNSDGSTFQGTPEQFVQQNSENFKKAFSNTKVRDPKGNIQITNHSTWDKFDEFDLNKFGQTDDGFYGKGAYFHPNTNSQGLYGDINMNSYVNIENPMPHETRSFFGREGRGSYWDSAKNEQVKIDDLGSLWKGKYDGYITPHGEYPLNDFNSTEYITNIPSNIKSATGNNGMFNMTNPNIYKAVVPGAIGLGALQQKKDGGIIKDDRGQWAKNKKNLLSLQSNWLSKFE